MYIRPHQTMAPISHDKRVSAPKPPDSAKGVGFVFNPMWHSTPCQATNQGYLQARFGGRLLRPPPPRKKKSVTSPKRFHYFFHPKPLTLDYSPPSSPSSPPSKKIGEILQVTLQMFGGAPPPGQFLPYTVVLWRRVHFLHIPELSDRYLINYIFYIILYTFISI